ncbi:MAG: ABC-2 transporter permease [Chloroflexi bacterium]|nr:ABC-2 transporter permease [Chloroflexota bacterium]
MLNQILALTWKDLKIFFKDTGAVIFIFLQPFMFIVIMSYATAGMYGSGDRPREILAVNEDRGPQAAALIKQLDEMKGFDVVTMWEGQPLTREAAEKIVADGKRSMALAFPAEFSAALEQSPGAPNTRTTKIQIIVDPATPSYTVDPIAGTLQGLLERATFTAMMPRGIDLFFQQVAPQAPASQREAMKAEAQQSMSGGLLGGQTPVVTIEKMTPPGMRVTKFPDTFQQNVPGYTIYGIFWIVTMLASSVLQEKRDGTFRRLMVAPLNRAAMLAGKMLPYYIINLLQIVVMLGASSRLFGFALGSSPAGLIVVSLAAAATATGLGVLLSALARTEAQIGGMGTMLILAMSALGGSFVPRFTMPDWLKTAGLLTPHAWALDAYQDLFVRGFGLVDVLPKVGVLVLFAFVFFTVGVWRFRFQ